MIMMLAYVLSSMLLVQRFVASQQQQPVVCDCGFQDEHGRIWTNIWYADYHRYPANLHQDTNYVVMNYTVNAKYKDTLDRVFDPDNVQWSEDGVELLVRKATNGQNYTSASFGTKRQDLLYGTFRANLQTTRVPGTVAAFYFYRNNTCEIDMESLSRIQEPWQTYFSVQPQIYNPDGSASTLTNDKHELPFDPTSGYHEYRFDWLPTGIVYYLDGQEAHVFNISVPNAPGRLMLNHWTDGNPKFSGLPSSDADARLKVANLTVFFNTSEPQQPPLACMQSQEPCKVSDIMTRKLVPGSSAAQNASQQFASNRHLSLWLCILWLVLWSSASSS